MQKKKKRLLFKYLVHSCQHLTAKQHRKVLIKQLNEFVFHSLQQKLHV